MQIIISAEHGLKIWKKCMQILEKKVFLQAYVCVCVCATACARVYVCVCANDNIY